MACRQRIQSSGARSRYSHGGAPRTSIRAWMPRATMIKAGFGSFVGALPLALQRLEVIGTSRSLVRCPERPHSQRNVSADDRIASSSRHSLVVGIEREPSGLVRRRSSRIGVVASGRAGRSTKRRIESTCWPGAYRSCNSQCEGMVGDQRCSPVACVVLQQRVMSSPRRWAMDLPLVQPGGRARTLTTRGIAS